MMKNVRMRAAGLAALAAAMACFVDHPALAQGASETKATSNYIESSTTQGDQVVKFVDDPLATDPNSAYGFTVRRPPGVIRLLLLRPRVNFVTELVKSVESL